MHWFSRSPDSTRSNSDFFMFAFSARISRASCQFFCIVSMNSLSGFLNGNVNAVIPNSLFIRLSNFDGFIFFHLHFLFTHNNTQVMLEWIFSIIRVIIWFDSHDYSYNLLTCSNIYWYFSNIYVTTNKKLCWNYNYILYTWNEIYYMEEFVYEKRNDLSYSGGIYWKTGK